MAAVKPDPGQDNGGAEQKPDVQKIKITVRFGADRDDLQINVKPHTPFSKIYRAVAEHQGKSEDSFTLSFEGHRIGKTETPGSLDFEEEEVIDMHLAQVGGGAVEP
ncbi:hypothetical protein NBRC10512_003314 [Rhodotorula toruloides]|uniref:RHTO0S24e00496g1_1 n=2 Tax=Rhodotorula toruloides TaxID=5286 RepID=A0A061BIK3_RHOTO|nr:small ubiquitin-related modifier 3 precursor [Rhodotorula toruloides NP11]EMS19354.1 small ubiquitin-related modifier 3 precursor [Rhodotorula toruloides NP11]CDR49197.1 RHTO0S24e00496g1_1 [Rhodotorula toruloides]